MALSVVTLILATTSAALLAIASVVVLQQLPWSREERGADRRPLQLHKAGNS